MNGVITWATGVCLTALGCSAVKLLVPDKGTGRLLKLLLSVVLVCCMLFPLLSWQMEGMSWPITGHTTVEADSLQERVLAQYRAQVERALHTVTQQALEAYHLDFKKVTAEMDMDEEGRIYITTVTVYLDANSTSQAVAVKQVMEQRLEREVNVEVIS